MNQYSNLLHSIADELDILRGDHESRERWKSRIIYSVLGRMAYASLFDSCEEFQEPIQNNESVSVTHLKRRIQRVFDSYLEIYPEIRFSFSVTGKELSNSIYDIFLKTGCIYHESFRIRASAPCCATKGIIRFERGMPLNRHQYVSGLGAYTEVGNMPAFTESLSPSVSDMFGLSSDTLLEQWNALVSAVNWQRLETTDGVQYLRENPPFQFGYWMNAPDIQSGKISVCRMGQPGNYTFYLYRMQDKKIIVSSLPRSLVIDPHFSPTTYYLTDRFSTVHHRLLATRYQTNYYAANCSLAAHHCLPEITYQKDGSIVKLFLQYILPLPELYFLKLYSWPLEFSKTSVDFRRVISVSVFEAIKSILKKIGYSFVEV